MSVSGGPSERDGHSAANRREKARPEMLSILDRLCRDSLECPLVSAQTHPENGEIHAAFARLAWLIEEVVHA